MNFAKIMEYDEGRVPYAYQDSEGHWTIGIGTLIDKDKGGRISDAAIDFLFNEGVEQKKKELDEKIPWWKHESQVRQWAMLNMCYQMGVEGVLGFHDMLSAWENGDYKEAAAHALDSKYAREDAPKRARRVAHMIEFDEVPKEYL